MERVKGRVRHEPFVPLLPDFPCLYVVSTVSSIYHNNHHVSINASQRLILTSYRTRKIRYANIVNMITITATGRQARWLDVKALRTVDFARELPNYIMGLQMATVRAVTILRRLRPSPRVKTYPTTDEPFSASLDKVLKGLACPCLQAMLVSCWLLIWTLSAIVESYPLTVEYGGTLS